MAELKKCKRCVWRGEQDGTFFCEINNSKICTSHEKFENWLKLDLDRQNKAKTKCTCELTTLMNRGCQCGGK